MASRTSACTKAWRPGPSSSTRPVRTPASRESRTASGGRSSAAARCSSSKARPMTAAVRSVATVSGSSAWSRVATSSCTLSGTPRRPGRAVRLSSPSRSTSRPLSTRWRSSWPTNSGLPAVSRRMAVPSTGDGGRPSKAAIISATSVSPRPCSATRSRRTSRARSATDLLTCSDPGSSVVRYVPTISNRAPSMPRATWRTSSNVGSSAQWRSSRTITTGSMCAQATRARVTASKST